MATRFWRWWFEDRRTGAITVAQFPNWSLWAIIGCWVARSAVADGSDLHGALGWAISALWLVWGADELVRGVNPWRRLLGTLAIVWQAVVIVAS